MFYLIGIGLKPKHMTLEALHALEECDSIYLETYTSLLQCTIADLEQLYGKKITLANRQTSEQGEAKIIQEAKTKEITSLYYR